MRSSQRTFNHVYHFQNNLKHKRPFVSGQSLNKSLIYLEKLFTCKSDIKLFINHYYLFMKSGIKIPFRLQFQKLCMKSHATPIDIDKTEFIQIYKNVYTLWMAITSQY